MIFLNLFSQYSPRHSNKQNGITLIALVVTVVVLLILAGITITLLFGENGLINKAQGAADATQSDHDATSQGLQNLANAMNTALHENDGGSGESGGTGPDSSEEGDGNDPGTGGSEEWKALTVTERIEKLQTANPTMYWFYEGDNISSMEPSAADSNHFNTLGATATPQDPDATCECKQLKNIYQKAKEMGLIKTYNAIEEYTYMSGDRECSLACIFAPITEPSLVYYSFECFNSDQKKGRCYTYAIRFEL